MKKRKITHAHESAKIYQSHYRPSFNIFRVFRSILFVVISGSAAVSPGPDYARKK